MERNVWIPANIASVNPGQGLLRVIFGAGQQRDISVATTFLHFGTHKPRPGQPPNRRPPTAKRAGTAAAQLHRHGPGHSRPRLQLPMLSTARKGQLLQGPLTPATSEGQPLPPSVATATTGPVLQHSSSPEPACANKEQLNRREGEHVKELSSTGAAAAAAADPKNARHPQRADASTLAGPKSAASTAASSDSPFVVTPADDIRSRREDAAASTGFGQSPKVAAPAELLAKDLLVSDNEVAAAASLERIQGSAASDRAATAAVSPEVMQGSAASYPAAAAHPIHEPAPSHQICSRGEHHALNDTANGPAPSTQIYDHGACHALNDTANGPATSPVHDHNVHALNDTANGPVPLHKTHGSGVYHALNNTADEPAPSMKQADSSLGGGLGGCSSIVEPHETRPERQELPKGTNAKVRGGLVNCLQHRKHVLQCGMAAQLDYIPDPIPCLLLHLACRRPIVSLRIVV